MSRVDRSQSESIGAFLCNALVISHFILLCFVVIHFARVAIVSTPDNSDQLRRTSDVSRRLHTFSDCRKCWADLPSRVGLAKLSESNRSRLRIFANFTLLLSHEKSVHLKVPVATDEARTI